MPGQTRKYSLEQANQKKHDRTSMGGTGNKHKSNSNINGISRTYNINSINKTGPDQGALWVFVWLSFSQHLLCAEMRKPNIKWLGPICGYQLFWGCWCELSNSIEPVLFARNYMYVSAHFASCLQNGCLRVVSIGCLRATQVLCCNKESRKDRDVTLNMLILLQYANTVCSAWFF